MLEDEILGFVLVSREQSLVKADAGIEGRLVTENNGQELELRDVSRPASPGRPSADSTGPVQSAPRETPRMRRRPSRAISETPMLWP